MHREKKRGPASELEEARTERFLGDLNFDRRRSFLGREMRDDEDKYECLESFEEEGREGEANGAASIAAVQNQNLSSRYNWCTGWLHRSNERSAEENRV